MRESLELQRWLGVLALLAAVPLPFTGAAAAPVLLPYVVVALVLILARRPIGALPTWAENVAAVAIMVAVVAIGGMRFGVLRPVAHLALLVAVVRLPGGWQRPRRRSSLALIGLVAIAGIASSTHPTLVLHLAVLLGVVAVAVARLELVRLAAPGVRPGWPSGRLVGLTVLIAVVTAAPLFVLLPRLRSPFARAPFGARSVSGFRGTVELNNVGYIQTSRARVLTARLEGEALPAADWLRLAGATSQHYRGGMWAQGRLRGSFRERPLAPARVPVSARRVEVRFAKPTSRLFVPPGTLGVELEDDAQAWRGALGSYLLGDGEALTYTAAFLPGYVEQVEPEPADLEVPEDLASLGPLARQLIAGTGTETAAAMSLEAYFMEGFQYSTALSLDAPFRQDPVLWFLSARRGHCEFFASAMVLLLRSAGIPARLQTGYAGGDFVGDGTWVVRDANAHAWVLAHVDGAWRVFDPTPPSGRPEVTDRPLAWRWALGWSRLEEAWDRWVLTFSLADQASFMARVLEKVAERGPTLLRAVVIAGALLLLGRRLRGRLPHLTVPGAASDPLAEAVGKLESLAGTMGLVDGRPHTPRVLARVIAAAVPAARAPVTWLVTQHERASYGGRPGPAPREVRRALAVATAALRRR